MEQPNAIGYIQNRLNRASSICTFYFGKLVEICKNMGATEEI
jgi:hypothetical protein